MEAGKFYTLPKLPFGYKSLAPYISEEQLTLHHQKHHQAYVTGANNLLEKIDKARNDSVDLDMKATLKELSFHIGGYRLHKLFWENMAPAGTGGGGLPEGDLLQQSMMNTENMTGSERSLPRQPRVSKVQGGLYSPIA